MTIITARSYPLNEDGTFQSEVAESVYQEVMELGIGRGEVRAVIQAFIHFDAQSTKKYEKWSGRCSSCRQALPQEE